MAQLGLTVKLHTDFETALQKVTDALKAEGFGVLTEIDVKATLKKKLDVDFRPYRILGACNPPLAYRAFQAEIEIGILLPCNVIVYENGEGRSVVSAMAPLAAIGMLGGDPALKDVAREADERLRRMLAAVEQAT
jgi:uncharacterized protein (DUF302 family)